MRIASHHGKYWRSHSYTSPMTYSNREQGVELKRIYAKHDSDEHRTLGVWRGQRHVLTVSPSVNPILS